MNFFNTVRQTLVIGCQGNKVRIKHVRVQPKNLKSFEKYEYLTLDNP